MMQLQKLDLEIGKKTVKSPQDPININKPRFIKVHEEVMNRHWDAPKNTSDAADTVLTEAAKDVNP